jgi:8-oxo-dGTP diphosphatase
MNNQLTETISLKSHLGIYAVIEHQGRILLVKKTRGPYTGMWDLPGGRPEHGESISQTLTREVKEETGLDLLEAAFLNNYAFVVDYMEGEQKVSLHHTCLIYKATNLDFSQIQENIHEEDVAGCCWIELSQLTNTPLSKVVLCAMQL